MGFVLNYATELLEATHAFVTLDTHLLQTTILAMVSSMMYKTFSITHLHALKPHTVYTYICLLTKR